MGKNVKQACPRARCPDGPGRAADCQRVAIRGGFGGVGGELGAAAGSSTLTPDRRLPHHPGMERRRFLVTWLTGALAAPLTAEAQQAGQTYQNLVLRT